MPDFYTVVTDTGLQALGLASTQGQSFFLTHAVVGDGNGLAVIPNKGMTTLVNEVWRGNVAGIKVDPKEPNTYIFEFAIPADTGGFSIREVGLMDESGKLFCIGNFPETEKPVAADGSVRDLVVRLPLHFENADVVNLVIDPAIVLATKQDVVDHNEDPQAHRLATTAQTGFVRLATDTEHIAHTRKNIAATPWGVWKLLESVMSNACASTSTFKIATSNAVCQVFNRIETHKAAGDPHGVVAKVKKLLSSSITSTSTTMFATPKAVKTVRDLVVGHTGNPAVHVPSGGSTGDALLKSGSSAKWTKLALVAVGHIDLVPFRPDALPQYFYMCNGEVLLKTSAAGKTLRAMPSTYKSDWGITENSTHIFLPNVFSGSDGYFFRAVNGSSRRVGNTQGDTIRNITGEVWPNILVQNPSGVFSVKSASSRSPSLPRATHNTIIRFDASTLVPTSHENRPKNIGFTPAIYLPPLEA